MRSDKTITINAQKQYKRGLIKKRLAAFFLVFFLYTGLIAVDRAGSEITGYPEHLALRTGRLDSGHISVFFLGREAAINTAAIAGQIEILKDVTAAVAENIAAMARPGNSKRKIEDIQVLLPGKTL
ncbi:hypothetical protein MASR2M70_13970 [Bacillota bacterium]